MKSLRNRLLLAFLGALTLILFIVGVTTYLKIRERVYADSDSALRQRAQSLAALIEDNDDHVEVDWVEEREDGLPPGHIEGQDCCRLIDKEGKVYAQAGDFSKLTLPEQGWEMGPGPVTEVRMGDGRVGRYLKYGFRTLTEVYVDDEKMILDLPKGRELWIVQVRRDHAGETLVEWRALLWWLWASGVALGGLLLWWVVRRSLRPVRDLRNQVENLSGDIDGKRVRLSESLEELEPIKDELNLLLDRVDKAFERERKLTSHLAHELRTPVSGLLANLEITLMRDRDATTYRESNLECYKIAKRMHWLVSNLLSMSRIEAGEVKLQFRMVRFAEFLPSWWDPFASLAAEKSLRVEWDIDPEACIETDAEYLRVVVSNLFDNAVCYTPEGRSVRISVDAKGLLQVGNKALDLSTTEVEHIFESFWRSGPRQANANHAGLGLNLCREVLRLLGGTIMARVDEGSGWFEVSIDCGTPLRH